MDTFITGREGTGSKKAGSTKKFKDQREGIYERFYGPEEAEGGGLRKNKWRCDRYVFYDKHL